MVPRSGKEAFAKNAALAKRILPFITKSKKVRKAKKEKEENLNARKQKRRRKKEVRISFILRKSSNWPIK